MLQSLSLHLMDNEMTPRNFNNALSVSAIYFLLGLSWIYFSDLAVATIASNKAQLTLMQTYKGWFFIVATSIILFFLSYWFFRKEYLAHLHFDVLAHRDTLTQLPNRLSLVEYLDDKCTQEEPFAFLFLDLDRFKEINDSYGHRFGDELLIYIAQILYRTFPKESYLVRTGGDEFVIILPSHKEPKVIAALIEKLFDTLTHPIFVQQTDIYINASIGIAQYPTDGRTYEELLQKADSAMYNAKKSGHSGYSFYEASFIENSLKRTTLSTNLKKALQNNELTLFYQPQVDIKTNQIIGAEALCRWLSPSGIISPSEFIPFAEESGLILEIGELALVQSAAFAKEWHEKTLLSRRVAVNVSAKQLSHPMFLETLDRILALHQCSPELIELEITESAILENPKKILALLQSIKAKGFHLSMDDFGTGYSSLSYLKDLPIDKLKIDQSFVRNIAHNPKNQIIVEAIINLGKGLGMEVLAEGVETAEELNFLSTLGIDSVQGYLFYHPLSVQIFREVSNV